jgi:hypothetical protein
MTCATAYRPMPQKNALRVTPQAAMDYVKLGPHSWRLAGPPG